MNKAQREHAVSIVNHLIAEILRVREAYLSFDEELRLNCRNLSRFSTRENRSMCAVNVGRDHGQFDVFTREAYTMIDIRFGQACSRHSDVKERYFIGIDICIEYLKQCIDDSEELMHSLFHEPHYVSPDWAMAPQSVIKAVIAARYLLAQNSSLTEEEVAKSGAFQDTFMLLKAYATRLDLRLTSMASLIRTAIIEMATIQSLASRSMYEIAHAIARYHECIQYDKQLKFTELRTEVSPTLNRPIFCDALLKLGLLAGENWAFAMRKWIESCYTTRPHSFDRLGLERVDIIYNGALTAALSGQKYYIYEQYKQYGSNHSHTFTLSHMPSVWLLTPQPFAIARNNPSYAEQLKSTLTITLFDRGLQSRRGMITDNHDVVVTEDRLNVHRVRAKLKARVDYESTSGVVYEMTHATYDYESRPRDLKAFFTTLAFFLQRDLDDSLFADFAAMASGNPTGNKEVVDQWLRQVRDE